MILLAVLALFTGIVVFAAPSSQAQPVSNSTRTDAKLQSDTTAAEQRAAGLVVYSATVEEAGAVPSIVIHQPGEAEPVVDSQNNRLTINAPTATGDGLTEAPLEPEYRWDAAARKLYLTLSPAPSVARGDVIEAKIQWTSDFSGPDMQLAALEVESSEDSEKVEPGEEVEIPAQTQPDANEGPSSASVAANDDSNNDIRHESSYSKVRGSNCIANEESVQFAFQVESGENLILDSFVVVKRKTDSLETVPLPSNSKDYRAARVSSSGTEFEEITVGEVTPVHLDIIPVNLIPEATTAEAAMRIRLKAPDGSDFRMETKTGVEAYDLTIVGGLGSDNPPINCDSYFRILAVTKLDLESFKTQRPTECTDRNASPEVRKWIKLGPRDDRYVKVTNGKPETRPNPPKIPAGTNPGFEGRQGSRTLTDEEKQRGSTGFAIASSPNNGNRHHTQLYYQVHASEANDDNTFHKIGEPTGWVYNALAFNTRDNWLYAISQPRLGLADSDLYYDENGKLTSDLVPAEDPCFPAGHLLQINPENGTVYDLGKVTGDGPDDYGFGGEYAQHFPNDLWGGISVGFFDKKGQYWVSNSSKSGTGALYRVNLEDVTAEAKNPDIAFATEPSKRRRDEDFGGPSIENGNPWRASSEDFAVTTDGEKNYAWGLMNSWAYKDPYEILDNVKEVWIERIDLDTGEVRRFNVTGLNNPAFGEVIPRGKIWGKAWAYPNDLLAFGTGSYGADAQLVQIKINNPDQDSPEFELVSVEFNAPQSYNTDGAAVTIPGNEADLRMNKKFLGIHADSGQFRWQLELVNDGPGPVSGAIVEDILKEAYQSEPDYTAYARIESIEKDFPGGTIATVYGHNIRVKFGRIPPGGRARITFQAPAPDVTDDGCFTNRAVVKGLDKDPKPENNVATASNCELSLAKDVVDINESYDADGEDARIPVRTDDGSEVFGVQYDLIITGPRAGAPQPYILRDMPQFSPGVQVLGAQVISAVAHGGVNEHEVLIPPTVLPNFAFTGPPPSAGWEIISEKDKTTIAAGQTHTYRIQVNYRLTNQLTLGNSVCAAGAAAKGLINTATLVAGEITDSDDACAPIETVTLAIDKLGMPAPASGAQPSRIEQGAEFTIYERNYDGTRGAEVARRDVRESEEQHPARGYYAAGLKKDTLYYLVETKAPEGHHLLAEPVLFELLSDDKGTLYVQFYDSNLNPIYNSAVDPIGSGDGLVGTFVQNEQQKNTATVAYIQVADVTQGQLPRTGKAGVGLWALAGAVLIGLGAFVARRRMV